MSAYVHTRQLCVIWLREERGEKLPNCNMQVYFSKTALESFFIVIHRYVFAALVVRMKRPSNRKSSKTIGATEDTEIKRQISESRTT